MACRLIFDCTPESEFLGFTPNGARERFAEHVFYDYRDGRIAGVWSLIDRAAIEAQLPPDAAGARRPELPLGDSSAVVSPPITASIARAAG